MIALYSPNRMLTIAVVKLVFYLCHRVDKGTRKGLTSLDIERTC